MPEVLPGSPPAVPRGNRVGEAAESFWPCELVWLWLSRLGPIPYIAHHHARSSKRYGNAVGDGPDGRRVFQAMPQSLEHNLEDATLVFTGECAARLSRRRR